MSEQEPPCTSILAGNSRLDTNEAGTFTVESQLQAFTVALETAAKTRDRVGSLPAISVAFDHRGVFRKQFLAPGLTNSQKRNPRLSQLHPDISDVFAATAQRLGISLGEIHVIHEDSAKEHLAHLLKGDFFDPELAQQAFANDDGSEHDLQTSCNPTNRSGPKATCAAITTEYFWRAARGTGKMPFLEVFIENDAWSQVSVYIRGLELAHHLGSDMNIRLNIVGKDGSVVSGEIVGLPKSAPV